MSNLTKTDALLAQGGQSRFYVVLSDGRALMHYGYNAQAIVSYWLSRGITPLSIEQVKNV